MKSKVRSRLLAAAAAFSLLLGLVSLPAHAFTVARAPYHFVFPRDHGAHDDYQSEWWYYTGHLLTPDGRRFGFELTLFRIALSTDRVPRGARLSRWRGDQLYPAHFAVTDDTGKTFFYDERLSRQALDMGGASTGRLDAHAGDWRVSEDVAGNFEITAQSGGHALHLLLSSRKPPAIHGSGGIDRKGACSSCASHYYSMTRLSARGNLSVDGHPSAVRGTAWMDHEYASDQLERGQVGWDWFALQLRDGTEVMIYRLRTVGGGISKESGGSLIDRAGRVTPLSRDDVQIVVDGTWTSPHTRAMYPAAWRVSIPGRKLTLRLIPRVADQELFENGPGAISYWEGDVGVQTSSGAPFGDAYVELTGYSGQLRL